MLLVNQQPVRTELYHVANTDKKLRMDTFGDMQIMNRRVEDRIEREVLGTYNK